MTNLKGSSGTTRGAVQGPHSRLIFRLARWPSKWLFGGPRTAFQKAPFCRKKRFFYFLWSPNWLSGKGSSGSVGGCPAYRNIHTHTHTYIYIYIYMALDRFAAYVLAKQIKISPVLESKMDQKKWTPKRAKHAFFCCPSFFYVSHRKRQNVLFQLEKVGSKLV